MAMSHSTPVSLHSSCRCLKPVCRNLPLHAHMSACARALTRPRGAQAMCFLAGANSIFDGDKLLTTANNERDEDAAMFAELGLTPRPAFLPYPAGAASSNGAAAPPAPRGEQRAAALGTA